MKLNRSNPWASKFGRSYAERNDLTAIELDNLYRNNYGISRSDLNEEFLSGLSRTASILEVGCNLGLQLQLLRKQGYRNLYGFDISAYALILLKMRTRGLNLLRSTAIRFPFKEESFDVIFSSGVLIHINPNELDLVLNEMYRCSRKYIWCFEYFAQQETEVKYRDKKGLLWKMDFLKKFTQRFPDLSVVRSKKIKYAHNDNIDIMFLLIKPD